MGAFSTLHPLVCMVYFIFAIVFSMALKHPIYLLTEFGIIVVFCFLLDRGKALKSSIKGYLVMAFFVFLINPLFSSRGQTILLYFRDRPITLEAIVYGGLFAISLLTLLMVFVAYNRVITSDKFLFLTASIIPKTAFSILITMRFIPLLKRRLKEIVSIQKSQGKFSLKQRKRQQVKESMETLNTLVTWSLESSLQTAASMRSRGYGVGKRSSVKRYQFDQRDWITLSVMILLGGVVLTGRFLGYGLMTVYPSIRVISFDVFASVHYLSFFLLMMLPILFEGRESIQWHIIKLKI